jgi:hypothetical protein
MSGRFAWAGCGRWNLLEITTDLEGILRIFSVPVVISRHFLILTIRITAGPEFFFRPQRILPKMADDATVQTVSDDEPVESFEDSALASDTSCEKKRKATRAAAHRVLKRVDGKRLRLTNEQKTEIAVYADKNAQLSREDVLSWAVKQYDLDGVPAPALISTLRKPEKVKWAKVHILWTREA